MTTGGNNFNEFAENQLTCVPEIFLSKNEGVKMPCLSPGKFPAVTDPLTLGSLVPGCSSE